MKIAMNSHTLIMPAPAPPGRRVDFAPPPVLLRKLALLAGLALLAVAGLARAAVSAYEPFGYTVGTLANNAPAAGNGFAGNWTCGAAGNIVAGLAYPGLPVANNALSSGSARQFVRFSSPLSTGTKWISFLLTSSANMGGNIDGVFFPNGNPTCLFFGWGLNPNSPSQGGFNIGSMTTAGSTAQGAASLLAMGLGTYASNTLVVMQIVFNPSGTNDTVTIYTNPVANAAAPGVPVAGTYNAYDVGTISGVGLNVQGAANITVDEIHVGDTYGDVVGYVGAAPNPPTGVNATPGANHVSLGWAAATGSPTGYTVKRSASSGGSYSIVGTTIAPIVAYNDPVLGGQTYYYVVSAVNGSGESSNSSPPVAASPTLAAPAAPTGLTATAGNAQVVLSWTGSAFATSYNVKRATASGGTYLPIGSTTDPAVTYTDSIGLNNGTTYYYVVSATGPGGTSSDTSPVGATPVAPAPLLVNIARGPGIRWFASNGVTYQLQWSDALAGTNTVWNSLGGIITGNGATNTVFDPVGPPHNYFQVLSIQ